MGEIEVNSLVREPETELLKPSHRFEGCLKIDNKEVGCGSVGQSANRSIEDL